MPSTCYRQQGSPRNSETIRRSIRIQDPVMTSNAGSSGISLHLQMDTAGLKSHFPSTLWEYQRETDINSLLQS